LQGDEEEEETDNLVNQVLDEIGINLDEQMVAAPGQKVQVLPAHSMAPALLCLVPTLPAFQHTLPLLSVVLHALWSPANQACSAMCF